jgi:ribosomal protein L37E
MIKLCEKCRNIYTTVIGDNKIHYECQKCGHKAPSSDMDSLQYSIIFGVKDEIVIPAGFLEDKANSIEDRECSSCGYPQMVYAILGKDCVCIYGCTNCKKIERM